jgi:colanic acid biosynthesis glycosyl transferase WcaI
MSRVLLLSLVFAPDGVSTSVLMTELAQELKQCGHEVTVLTTTPHYNADPEARARQPLAKRWGGLLYYSTLDGIPVYHASIPEKGSRVGARLLDYARFHLISTIAGLTTVGKYDVILAPSPPLTIGLSAWVLRLLRGTPFIYNVQEIYPDIAVSLGMLENRRVIRLLEMVERFIYQRAHIITVISERFRQQLLKKGVPEQKLQVIPNFVDTEFVRPGPRDNAFSARYGLNDNFVVLYAGNIGLTQGFETILAAARKVQHIGDIRFLIVGDGTRRSWLQAQLEHGDHSNVTLLPYQPRSTVPDIYATGDVCLVPLKRGTAQGTFPSKVYTIMAAARPVIASADADSELAYLVERADCGWITPPDDATALADAIRISHRERNAREQKRQSGYEYVHRYHSREAVARQYDRLLRLVAEGS